MMAAAIIYRAEEVRTDGLPPYVFQSFSSLSVVASLTSIG